MSMQVIVPTRGRPHNARRLINAWKDTEAACDLLFCIDDDDPCMAEYLSIPADFVVGQRLRIGPTLNEQAIRSILEYDIIGFMGDDHLPRTHHWDVPIAQALHQTGIAYGNDLLQGQNLPTAVFMTSDIPASLGYFCPPGLLHMYLDDSWKAWGSGADCLHYLDDVVIEHMHPGLSKAAVDQVYEQSNVLMESDRIRYQEYCLTSLADDILKIRGLT